MEDQDRERLEQKIGKEEVIMAIKDLKLGKSPGPDGITGLFYKTYIHTLAPFLTELYNEFIDTGRVTPSMQEAVITIIPKQGKDPQECGSYRPISLLNIDANIFTKILANRLKDVLHKLIHPDQTGFILGRTTFDNTRKVIHLIEKAQRSKVPSFLVSLDAEKAFDRIEWNVMHKVLEHVGMGPRMRAMIAANYVHPTASVRVNGGRSRNFMLERGTRQGCPLSPLLFALSLEPLAIAIRKNPQILGIPLGGTQYKISLFADDIILSLQEPRTSLPAVMETLRRYSEITGFKINYTKSEALNITIKAEDLEEVKKLSPLQWSQDTITYLGIKLTNDTGKLYDANYPNLIKRLKKDIIEWEHVTQSWMGRISIIKMNILPRLLYYFQALPIEVPQKTLTSFQQFLMKFIWNNKKPRVKKLILFKPKAMGGLSCPDIFKYYIAAQLRVMWEWSQLESTKAWVQIEKSLVVGELGAQAWLTQAARHGNVYIDTPLRTFFKTWDWAMKKYNLSNYPSPFIPLWNNPDFKPGCDGRSFQAWEEGGCGVGRDLISEKKKCKSFTQCQLDFSVGNIEKLRYLQVRHWVDSPLISTGITRELTVFEKMISTRTTDKGILGEIYKILNVIKTTPKWQYQEKWEEELGKNISEGEWEKIWRRHAKTSICVQIAECNYKVLLRWHMTPVKLHSINPELSEMCWRGCGQRGTFIHMWWYCPKVSRFWKIVASVVSTIIGLDFPWDPGNMLLNMPLGSVYPLTSERGRLITNLLSAAKSTIARYWKFAENLNKEMWLIKIWENMKMDKLTCNLQNANEVFQDTWGPFIEYVRDNPRDDICPKSMRTMLGLFRD